MRVVIPACQCPACGWSFTGKLETLHGDQTPPSGRFLTMCPGCLASYEIIGGKLAPFSEENFNDEERVGMGRVRETILRIRKFKADQFRRSRQCN
jgi:hypothetical protein